MRFDALADTLTEALVTALRDANRGVLSLPTLGLITDHTPQLGTATKLAVWLIDLPASFPTFSIDRQAEAVAAVARILAQPTGKARMGIDPNSIRPPLACVLLRDDPQPDPDHPVMREALAVDVDNQCYLCQDTPTDSHSIVLVTPPTAPRTVPDLGALYEALSEVLQAGQP